jgi:hypothetical protein
VEAPVSGELYTESVSAWVRRPVRTGVLTLRVRESREDLYIPCTMTTNNRDWDKAWFYLRNDDGRLPAYTGKILTERPESWGYRVSPPERQTKLKVYSDALCGLAGKGLTAAAVVANFHRQRVLPFMERKLPLYKLTTEAPCEGSRMMEEPLSHEIAAQRVGRTVASPLTGLGDLWGIKMRPEAGVHPTGKIRF